MIRIPNKTSQPYVLSAGAGEFYPIEDLEGDVASSEPASPIANEEYSCTIRVTETNPEVMRLFYGDLTATEKVSYIEEGSEGDHLPAAETTENPTAQKEHNMATATPVHPSTNTEVFDFEGHNVRTVLIDNEPWFVLGDVAKVLGITRSISDLKKRLDQQDVGTTGLLDSRGHNRQNAIVNESGLYDVILDSRKPQAKQFRRWITSEVIPSIRKHGGYLTPESIEKTLTDPDFIIQLAQNLKSEQEKRAEAEKKLLAESEAHQATQELSEAQLKQSQEYKAEAQPKVDAYDQLIRTGKSQTVGTVGKHLGIGQNKLFEFLREEKILMSSRGDRYNLPYQKYVPYFDVKQRLWVDSYGDEHYSATPYVRPTGMDFIRKRLIKAGRI